MKLQEYFARWNGLELCRVSPLYNLVRLRRIASSRKIGKGLSGRDMPQKVFAGGFVIRYQGPLRPRTTKSPS
jgi:hypothetical protein